MKKILAVDDMPDNLIAIGALVRDLFPDLEMISANAGAEALSIARERQPDVIALDIRMPDMDGFEVCERLKADPETRDIPIIFVTAMRDSSKIKFRALESGAEGFLPKPIEIPDFIVMIRSMLRIRDANLERRSERERLYAMVEERTAELRRAQSAMLSLLEDLKEENETRKRTERELAARRAYLESILQATQDGFFRVAADGAFVDANEAFADMLGYREPLPRSLSLGEVDATHGPAELAELLGDVAENRHRTVTCDLRRRDGSTFPAELAISYLSGNVPGYIAFCRDVTERNRAIEDFRLLQEELYHSQKMESIGRLAGGVAHDFNNMLGVIIGQTELSLDAVGPEDALHGRLLEIRAAALRSSALTRQLLAFARKQTISPKVLDLNETIESMLKMVRRLIGEDIELQWSPSGELCPVLIDPGQVDQILANLCVNARDAITGSGKIVIRTANAAWRDDDRSWPSTVPPGRYAKVEVADNGCGMDDSVISRVFEPFFTTKEVGKGTGLGLATVYGIVKQNGGHILLESAPGKGTTFAIYLPETSLSADAQRHERAGATKRGTGTVLLVEDEPILLEMTAEMLMSLGYRVLAAATPGAAMGIFAENAASVDMAITDVILPEMSGPELVAALREDLPCLPALFVSGYTAEEITGACLSDERNGFLQKPFSRNDLSDAVHSLMAFRQGERR